MVYKVRFNKTMHKNSVNIIMLGCINNHRILIPRTHGEYIKNVIQRKLQLVFDNDPYPV
jgi:hypothetical protein